MYIAETMIEGLSGRHAARLNDVSIGGCYIDTIIEATVGDRISFDIKNSDGEAVRFNGTVAYNIVGMGFGVKYDPLTDAQSKFLGSVAGYSRIDS